MSDAHAAHDPVANAISVDPQRFVGRAKDLIFQQFDDEWLAVDAQASVCFALNESAGRIWVLIENPISLDAICTQLCAEYDVDRQTCLQEVAILIQNMSQSGLVKIGDRHTFVTQGQYTQGQ